MALPSDSKLNLIGFRDYAQCYPWASTQKTEPHWKQDAGIGKIIVIIPDNYPEYSIISPKVYGQ